MDNLAMLIPLNGPDITHERYDTLQNAINAAINRAIATDQTYAIVHIEHIVHPVHTPTVIEVSAPEDFNDFD